MTKKFLIAGDIVAKDSDKTSFEDVTPTQIDMWLKGLGEDDEAVFEFNSCGGDVYAGLAISNLIKNCGHKTTARVISLAASIASVIAASCDELEIAENAFFMMHLPWCVAQGNAIDLANEIKTLDQCKKAIISVYKNIFPDFSEDGIEQMLVDETWILGSQAPLFGMKCEVIASEKDCKIAASIAKKFNNIPKDLVMEEKEEVKAEVEEAKAEEQPVEEKKDEVVAEEKKEEVKDEVVAEVKDTIETVTKAECDKRVSGMQSSMQAQINTQKKEYECKIADFMNQLKAKDEELTSVKNEITNLQKKLEDSAKELQTTASALAEKTEALAQLNASVNTPNEALPSFKDGLAKCNSLKERMEFISSGKYKRN